MNGKIEALKAAWKNRADYNGSAGKTPLYQSWRAMRFTNKGKLAGNAPYWDVFMNFYNDMESTHFTGALLCRLDKTKPFSKDNCIWIEKALISQVKPSTRVLEYNGKNQSLKDWSMELGIPLSGLTQRYHKGKRKYRTAEDILFGVKTGKVKDKNTAVGQSEKFIRTKASKMVAAYRCKDTKKERVCDLTVDWFINNILSKPCTYCGTAHNIGCDRVDNTQGHTIKNVIPSCYRCNVIRSDFFTVDEMKELGKVAKDIIDRRK